jgi:hypothetical protein
MVVNDQLQASADLFQDKNPINGYHGLHLISQGAKWPNLKASIHVHLKYTSLRIRGASPPRPKIILHAKFCSSVDTNFSDNFQNGTKLMPLVCRFLLGVLKLGSASHMDFSAAETSLSVNKRPVEITGRIQTSIRKAPYFVTRSFCN